MEKHLSWLTDKENELEKKVLAEYSSGEVQKHLEYLATLTRRAGSEDELKAAQYIRSRLEEYGVDAEVHEIDAYIGLPGKAEVEVLSPEFKSFPCLTRTFIPSTSPEGIEAELIYLGKGLEEDYRGVDVHGKIILAEPAYREGRLEVALLAEEKGASAQIHVTPGTSRVMAYGQLRYTWGNPTPDTMDKIPKIPAVSICNEDGKYLAELSKKGRVVVRLKADSWRGYKKIRLPMGFIKGAREPESFVLFGGHYCSWFLGASDNAAANSLILEMARIFSKHRKHLARSIRFAWWGGHEQGTYAGSTWYLDNFWDDIRDHAVAYLVMDGLGRVGASGFEPENTEEIRKFQERVVKDVLGLKVESKRVGKVGDQSFWGMGLPSVTGKPTFTGDKTAALWYSHTAEDTLDKVDVELIKIPFKVYGVSILRLCNSPVLPFEFVTVAELFQKSLDELEKESKSLLNLTSVIAQAGELKKKAGALNKAIGRNLSNFEKKGSDKGLKNKFKEVNACLTELSRVLSPVLSSKMGKYGQDPIGTKFKPIPTLQPVRKLNSMDSNGEEYKALYTSLVRERNKVADTLKLANRILDHTLIAGAL